MSEVEQIILPDGFKRVEYLQANGSQWFDTGYVPSNSTGMYVRAQQITHTNSCVMGSGIDTNSPADGFTAPRLPKSTGNTCGFAWGGWTSWGFIGTGDVFESQLNYLNDRKAILRILKDGGETYSSNLGTLPFTPVKSIYMFTTNKENAPALIWSGKIFEAKITEGTEVVKHFIPCLDADNVPCMYDIIGTGTIEENTYYNQGDGQFYYPGNYPPSIYPSSNYNLPAGFKKCIYLQSDGTQWIDTGVVPDNETGLYFNAMQLTYGNFIPFGVEENDNLIYPPRFGSSKTLVYRWGETYVNILTWDKAGDLIFHSSLNLYNSKLARFDSEDTDDGMPITSQTGTYTLPIWLFSYNLNGSYSTTYGKWVGRIYRAQITQGDALIRDFVPCLDANGRPCMYDIIGGGTVEDNTYYNQSGGTEFTYCVEHQLPSDFIKLKYLESTGTQYIKTGYVPTNTTGLYIDTQDVGSGDTIPMGLRESSSTNTRFFITRQTTSHSTGYGWGTWTSVSTTKGSVRYDSTLNWLNDRKSITNNPLFVTVIKNLEELPFTPSLDIWMFGINQGGSHAYKFKGRIYRAKISEGSEIVRDFVPAWDDRKQTACMYDLINNVAYYNNGEEEFLHNRDFEGTYKGYTGLGCIGNRLGSDYDPINEKLPSGYTRVEFLESILKNTVDKYGGQWINTDLYVKDLSFRIEYAGITGGGGNGSMVFGIEPGASGNFYGVLTQSNNYGIGCQTRCFKTSDGTHQKVYVSDVPQGTRVISEVNLQDLYCYIKVEGKETQKKSIINLTHDFADYILPCGLFSRGGGGIRTVSRVYSFSANYNGVPAANYIPAIDTAGIPCMYDTVTNKSLYNQGDGQFIVGLKTISNALQLKLPNNGGIIALSLPTNDKTEYYEEKIRANNPNWEITFYYH